MFRSEARFGIAAMALVASACATAPISGVVRPEVARSAVVHTAEDLIGRRQLEWNGRRFSSDCVGFVRLVYAANGIELAANKSHSEWNGVSSVYDFVQSHGSVRRDSPKPGDLVFFHDTYDRNGDGIANDGLTHVGIVQEIYPDGTVEVIHRVQRGVVRYRMNSDHPLDRTREGRVINDYLRRDPTGHSVTAGTLFAAYGTLIR